MGCGFRTGDPQPTTRPSLNVPAWIKGSNKSGKNPKETKRLFLETNVCTYPIQSMYRTFYLHEWLIVKVNAGKYTVPIDAMSMMKNVIYTLLIDGPSQNLYRRNPEAYPKQSWESRILRMSY